MRTVAIGDIHGCLELLMRLLGEINYDPMGDTLVFVGDYLDRGPNPIGVVRLIQELQKDGSVIAIRGNHDDKPVRWFDREERARTTGKPNGMRQPGAERLAQWNALSPEDLAWLRALPVFVKVLHDWYAVHAGFEELPLDKQKADHVMRVRWLDATTGEHKGMDRDAENPYEKPPGAVFWMERWKGPENVVYGHAVHSRARPRVDHPCPRVETWGIDTGACYGGALTALVLETREVVQVKDGKEYDRLYAVLQDGS